MRLHWFSPLLPDFSDIGHYTNRVVVELAKLCDVTVWTQTANPTALDAPNVAVRRFEGSARDYRDLNRDGVAIYNLGNNGQFHAKIFNVSQDIPGIVILHDADLQDLMRYVWTVERNDPTSYVDFMRETYGVAAEWFAKSRIYGVRFDDLVYRFPVTAPALHGALGLIGHTQQAARIATDLGLRHVDLNLPYPAGTLPVRDNRTGPIRLVQFGHANPHRRLDEILLALHRHPARAQFRFEILGSLWNEAHVQAEIARLGLTGIVIPRGFVSDLALDAAIVASDLVINLRYPTIGAASGTQLRLWKNAAPSVVTDDGWFGDLPDDAVLKIKPGREVEELIAIFDRLVADRTAFDALGRRGHEILRTNHAPADYAKAVLEFATEIEAGRGG